MLTHYAVGVCILIDMNHQVVTLYAETPEEAVIKAVDKVTGCEPTEDYLETMEEMDLEDIITLYFDGDISVSKPVEIPPVGPAMS